LSANIATIPPGGVAAAHIHVGFEVILYIIEGKVRHEFGAGLKQVLENEAGDFIYIKPGVPHEVFNMSDAEPVVAFVARSSAAEFEQLQRELVPLWRLFESFNQEEQTIVVVPSMSVDKTATGSETQGYEERFLFLLLLLTQPRARMIYVTSQAIHPSVIEYYLDLLSGVIPSHAIRRLTLLSPYDDSPRPLSLKLLERPRLLERIEAGIQDKERAHLVCYNTTFLERNLALRLGIPLYGADPLHLAFGTNSGCPQLFARAGINHPLGFDNLNSVDDVV